MKCARRKVLELGIELNLSREGVDHRRGAKCGIVRAPRARSQRFSQGEPAMKRSRSPSPRRRDEEQRGRDNARFDNDARRGDRGDESRRLLDERAEPPPPAGTVCQARVVSVQSFGAFVAFSGCATHALVHVSQLADRHVEHVSDVVKVGDQVWIRMLEEERPGRHSASMKVVDQSTGAYVGDVGGGDAAAGRRPRRSTEPEEDVSQMTWGLQPLDRGQDDGAADGAKAKPKAQPNFGTTGKLAEASNMVNGVSLKWVEPSDAMKPTKRWRLYIFKGKEALEPYHIHRQSAYLLGRERRVADIPLDHPSCSSQHAVLQFRLTSKTSAGKTTKLVRPYVMDLGSTNGTYVNGERIEAERYVELLERDLLRFGYSSREYVLLHEESGGGS